MLVRRSLLSSDLSGEAFLSVGALAESEAKSEAKEDGEAGSAYAVSGHGSGSYSACLRFI